jgi:PST family polysaccharide transporter
MSGGPNRLERSAILANAGWLYFDQMARAVLVLAAFGLMARSLGPERFGWLSYATAFPGIFLPLALLGLDYVVMRDLVRHPEEQSAILGTAMVLKAVTSLAAFGATLGAAWLLPIEASARPLIVATSLILLFQPWLTLDYYFQSQVAAKYSSLARLAACVVANGVRAWFAWHDAPVSWFAWAFAGEAACYAASLVMAWRVSGGQTLRGWTAGSARIARRMLASAWPLLLADIAIAGYLKLDQVLLQYFAGAEELGRYAAAYRLADAAEFFSLALINSYFPRLVRLHHEGSPEFEAEVGAFFRRMTWFAIAVAAAVSLTSPWIGAIVLGRRFDGAWPVLAVLTWANVFVTQIAVRGKWFLAEGWQIYSLAFFMVGAATHLGLLVWVAPRWGAIGAAGSFCLAQAVMALLAPAVFRRSRGAAGLALRSFRPGGV